MRGEMADDETIILRDTVIGGQRHPDDYQESLKRDGVPRQAEQSIAGWSAARVPDFKLRSER
jgi:hypothetical protein